MYKGLNRVQDARDELLEAEAAMPQSNALEVKGDSADVQVGFKLAHCTL